MWAAAVALLAIITGCFRGLLAVHSALGIAAVALACFYARRHRAARIAVVLGIVECALRGPIIHACLSPVFFAACAAIGVKPSSHRVRWMIQSIPLLVFFQIVLGAAYRHKAIGVMPHMAGALLVAGLLLGVSMTAWQRYALKAAGALLAIVLLQVSLGIAVFTMRILDAEATGFFVAADVAHITVGSLTLAVATILVLVIPDPSPRAQDSKP